MAITHRPNNRSSLLKKTTTSIQKKLPNLEEESKRPYFAAYTVGHAIEESGEFFAEVLEHVTTDSKDFIRMSPYLYKGKSKVYFEEVFLNLSKLCSPTTAAGQFLTLFAKARNFGDIKGRVVGIDVKLVKSKSTDNVFKNIVRVFETDEDELIFDDDHMTEPDTGTKCRTVNDVIDTTDETEEEEELLAESSRSSKFSDEIFDDEDFEDEDDLEEE